MKRRYNNNWYDDSQTSTMTPNTCDQDRCFLCRNCLPEWTELIGERRKVLHVRKGQHIFREGEEVRGLYFVLAGAVKVHQSWGSENEIILRFTTEGGVLGHRGQGATVFPITATALENTTVCFVPNDVMETTFKANPPFVYAMMQLYASELLKAERRMRNLALMPLKGRVAEALMEMQNAFTCDEMGYIRIPVTKLDIACYAGTTYEAVFRLFAEWSRLDIIETSGKKIKIKNEKFLLELIA